MACSLSSTTHLVGVQGALFWHQEYVLYGGHDDPPAKGVQRPLGHKPWLPPFKVVGGYVGRIRALRGTLKISLTRAADTVHACILL